MVRQVRCVNATCPRAGIIAVVADRLMARGVVARPPLHCTGCGDQVTEAPVDLSPVVEATAQQPVARAKPKARSARTAIHPVSPG